MVLDEKRGPAPLTGTLLWPADGVAFGRSSTSSARLSLPTVRYSAWLAVVSLLAGVGRGSGTLTNRIQPAMIQRNPSNGIEV